MLPTPSVDIVAPVGSEVHTAGQVQKIALTFWNSSRLNCYIFLYWMIL